MKNQRTQKWKNRLHLVLEKQDLKQQISNATLAQALDISERDLFRKIKAVTGLPPQKYARKYRLQLAMKMLKTGTCKTVKEASHAIGYLNVSYFILQFEKEFNIRPFEVLKAEGWR